MTNNNTASVWNKTWLSGVAGALSMLIMAFWFESSNTLRNGVELFGYSVTENRSESILFALVSSVLVVFFVELLRQKKLSSQSFFHYPTHKNINFYADCVVYYIQTVILLIAVKMFYQTANEYGYNHKAQFYQPWFMALALFTKYYYILGLPYIILTRSLKYNEEADKARYGALVGKATMLIVSCIPAFKEHKPEFASKEKQVFLSLLIKMFFLPLVIVFFFKVFPQLIQSISYLGKGMPNSFTSKAFHHEIFNRDLAHAAVTLLFSIHLVILSASYAITSRWIDNHKQVSDDTLLSWVACLIVFPPFIHLLITSWIEAMIGPALQEPSRVLMQMDNQSIVSACIIMMIVFYSLYIVSTVNIGMSYANLCYRKLVTNGLFAYVRHPIYSTKLLGLTCFIVPLSALNAADKNWEQAASLIGGLVLGYILFGIRALREERLLSQHCDYQAYRKQVPYRFIPKLF